MDKLLQKITELGTTLIRDVFKDTAPKAEVKCDDTFQENCSISFTSEMLEELP
jgi:hypothetical protein